MNKYVRLKPTITRYRRSFSICSVIVIIFFTFSCGGKPEKSAQEEIGELEELYATAPVESENAPYEGGTIFRMHMQSLDECEDALIDSVDRQDWEAIKKCAMDLKKASAVVYTGKDKKDLPRDFILIDTKFHYQALAVVEAAESREMVRLNIEYEKLRDTCDACHEKYKTKDM